jgi:L-galactono-1,4-lactone dehydrogenase
MSPACSDDPKQVFSWVGVIMYLPPAEGDEGNAQKRQNVTHEFNKYIAALEPLFEEYGAVPHWAKVWRRSALSEIICITSSE